MDQNRLTGLVIGGFIILLVPIWTRTVFGVETSVLTALATVREVKEALDEKRRILARIDAERDPAAADKARKHMTVAQEIHELAVTFSGLCAQRYPEYRSYFETSRGRIEIDYSTIQKRFQEITGTPAPGAATAPAMVAATAPVSRPPEGSHSLYRPAAPPAEVAPPAPPAPPDVVVTANGPIEPPVAAHSESRLGSVAVNAGRGGIGSIPAPPAPVAPVPAKTGSSGPVLHAPALAMKDAPPGVTPRVAPAEVPAPTVPATAQAWAPPGHRSEPAPAVPTNVTEVTKKEGTSTRLKSGKDASKTSKDRPDTATLHRPSLTVAEGESTVVSTPVTEVKKAQVAAAPEAPAPPARKPSRVAPPPPVEDPAAYEPAGPVAPDARFGAPPREPAGARPRERGVASAPLELAGNESPREQDEYAPVSEGPRDRAGHAPPQRDERAATSEDPREQDEYAPVNQPERERMAPPVEAARAPAAREAAVPINAPVGAMMDLPWNRYSSWGLSIAELIFEEPVAEGRSQVLAVFPSQDPRLRKIGPLSPPREASMEFARIIGAVAVHTDAEGQANVAGAVERSRRTRDPRLLEPGFFRMKQGPLSGRIFSSLTALSGSGLTVLDPVGVLSVSFTDSPHVMRNTDLLIPWGGQELPLFRYDGRTGRYHRVHGDEVVLDPLDGSPVVADNVVLLGRTTPQGVRCIVYTRGRINPGLLQPRRDLLVTPENQPIALKPGATWFLCPSGHVGIHAPPPPAAEARETGGPKLYGPGRS